MMVEQGKSKATPQLRFPEFREEREWRYTPLRELGEIITGKTPSTNDASLWNGSLLFITPTDISDDGKYQRKTQRRVVQLPGAKVLPVGSIVYTCIASIGKMAITALPSTTNQQINSIIVNRSVSNEFLFYALANLTAWIKTISASSTLPIINKSTFSEILVSTPIGSKEQQKIADCLTSLDEVIAAQEQKVEALKAHKRGLMQQLFPREGETRPRLRFPEFCNAPEWQERLLKEVVGSVKTGKLDANAMVDDGQYRFYTCAKNHYRIDKYAFDGEALLIAGNGAYLGYIHHYTGKFNAYQRTYVLQDFSINVAFLKCFLDRNFPSRIVLEKKDGNTPYIVLATITDMQILIPRDGDEQKYIADCLSSLDTQVAAESNQLAALKTHKQGLMQQLFPAPEGIGA